MTTHIGPSGGALSANQNAALEQAIDPIAARLLRTAVAYLPYIENQLITEHLGHVRSGQFPDMTVGQFYDLLLAYRAKLQEHSARDHKVELERDSLLRQRTTVREFLGIGDLIGAIATEQTR